MYVGDQFCVMLLKYVQLLTCLLCGGSVIVIFNVGCEGFGCSCHPDKMEMAESLALMIDSVTYSFKVLLGVTEKYYLVNFAILQFY